MNELFQITLDGKIYTFRRLSALAISKRVSFPFISLDEEIKVDETKYVQFAVSILAACCTTPSVLDDLNLLQLGKLATDSTFQAYIRDLAGIALTVNPSKDLEEEDPPKN